MLVMFPSLLLSVYFLFVCVCFFIFLLSICVTFNSTCEDGCLSIFFMCMIKAGVLHARRVF